MNPKKPRDTRSSLLPLAVAAACLATAMPARSYDPFDPAGPPADDPSAWRDAPAPARVARKLHRRDEASTADPSRADNDDPGSPHRGRSTGDEGEAARPSRTSPAATSGRTGAPSAPKHTFSSIPPWFGSEPYVFGFDEVAPRGQTQVAPRRPTLATSLGSEPFPAGAEEAPSAEVATVQHPTRAATLATSLGSEPFILEGGPSGDARAAGAPRTPAAGKELARTRE